MLLGWLVGDSVGDDCTAVVTLLKSTVIPVDTAVVVNPDVTSLLEVLSILFYD